jgi:rhodanese-related sulfurtransferase
LNKTGKGVFYRLWDRELLGATVVVMIAGGGLGILFNILTPRGLFRIPGGNSGKPAVVEREPAGKPDKVAAPVASEAGHALAKPTPVASEAGHALAKPAPVASMASSAGPAGHASASLTPVAGKAGQALSKTTPVAAKYVPRAIDFEEAKTVFRQGSAVWVDARSESSYNYGHVPGAINMPSSDFDRAYAMRSARLPRTGTIVVYCESADCDQAEHVLEKFIGLGYRNLVHFRQGWMVWEAAEMPQEPK